ncbi:pilus assembly protein [Mesorhizobium loti]|nr:TadE/TadG family type IV pilus assembly protein [Mesorhizobium loti]PLP59539.1 pilus assembly protein [Mesorhizobium loti]
MGQEGNRDGKARAMRRSGFLARFARDRRGSTAIEFAALAIPFSLLVFAILESCISFAGQEVLINATDDLARQLRTGRLPPGEVTTARLKDAICPQLKIIVSKDCPGLFIDLRTPTTFVEAATYGYKISDDREKIVLMKGAAQDTKQFVAEAGPETSINMLRVFYKWPVITDFLAKSMANFKDGTTLHYATNTWVNEPFGK